MIPGRSLPGNTSGRSIAPAAITTSRGAHLPQPLARSILRIGQMIGETLGKADHVVREVSERRGARQQRDIVAARERRDRFGEPDLRGLAVDQRVARSEQGAAELRLFVAQHHLCAGCGRRERGGEPGRAGADHQHIAMRVAARVAIRVRQLRRTPQPRHRADPRLIQALPRRTRPHEGLVVEARGDQRRDEIVHRGNIEAQARASGSGFPPQARHRARPAWRACSARNAPSSRTTVTSALGSSAPAARMPRGR